MPILSMKRRFVQYVMDVNLPHRQDFEESIEAVIAGYQKKNRVLSNKEKLIVSYHEIGHALVAFKQTEFCTGTQNYDYTTYSGALGYTMQVDDGEHYLMSKEELENKIATFTGGRAAEELIFIRSQQVLRMTLSRQQRLPEP